LVAEDNMINQLVVREFLKLSGFVVTIVNNGQEALNQLASDEFDVVLMDAHMPVMDGFEATALIRSQPRFANLPIIALTAGVTQDEREQCLNCGMNDFVAKPIVPETLLATLSHWLNIVRT
jgi:CheY-like chemotaxis protein